ncbi:pyrroline-5-carboxylate reductase [Geomonas sp. Red32]|uniref:pyrroline-5-carboxylate reductase n=1 Tax=Geomonas sp. Red32 TaxID=2912856 RepID=UPI00202D0254|nr:pyrroline-5-carboxylate reductase [Geomonas sp. Red32]MCM0082552.1 pyrroline-5-carboxylate reductase [Geomonas sp. Red32]
MHKEMKTGFIGGGNMAEAIIKGLLAGGVPAANLTVSEPSEQRRGHLSERYGIRTISDNGELCRQSDLVILAVKPQVFSQALKDVQGSNQLYISIMAGVKCAAIEEVLGAEARVVRVMPNTPALVLEGATAIARGTRATDDDLSITRRIFDLVGTSCVVEEKLLDAVTGVSGSGPAYVLTFIEALSDAGVKHGLTRDVATALAAQTVYGTAKLLLETREHPAVLKSQVASPGGTTIAAMHQLDRDGFRAATINAVDVCVARSMELGKK